MDTKEKIDEIIESVVRSEYGGCNPASDNPCVLPARVVNYKGYAGRALEVFVVGKWRIVTTCGWKGMPSNKTIQKAIKYVKINTGSYDLEKAGTQEFFNPNKGTFAGKEVMLRFERIDNAC